MPGRPIEGTSLRERLREHRSELLAAAARRGASNLRIFGSVARGDDHTESDVDFLVDVLALAESGRPDDLSTDDIGDAGTFTWKALGAVVVSTGVIALLGVSSVFWYVPAILAIGSAVAVVSAFLIDRRSTT